MKKNYLLIYNNYEGYLKYSWFETEESLSEFIDCNSVEILESLKLIEVIDLIMGN